MVAAVGLAGDDEVGGKGDGFAGVDFDGLVVVLDLGCAEEGDVECCQLIVSSKINYTMTGVVTIS